MPQTKPEYDVIDEFRTISLKLVEKYPEVLDGINPNIIRCVGVTNKEPKEGKCPWELRPVPMPIRLDCPYGYYVIVNMNDWNSWTESHKALLAMDVLCSMSREDDGKVIPFDMKDHSVMLRTVGVDYMKRTDIPNILNDPIVWKKGTNMKKTAKKTAKTTKKTVKKVQQSQSDLIKEIKRLKTEVDILKRKENVKVSKKIEATQKVDNKNIKDTVRKASDDDDVYRYELISYDEFNQSHIVFAAKDLDKVIEYAKTYVTDQNVNNALSLDENEKAWEVYFPQIFIDNTENKRVIYAGNKKNGRHYLFFKTDAGWEKKELVDNDNVDFRFFLGYVRNLRDKKSWYLTDRHDRFISSFDDINLENKSILFINIVM